MKKKVEAMAKKRNETLDLLIDGAKATFITVLGMGGLVSLIVHFTIGW